MSYTEENKVQLDNWIHRSTSMRCDNCIWFVQKGTFNGGRFLGRCRKHAPVVQLGWPAVFSTDWCGDHKLDEEKC